MSNASLALVGAENNTEAKNEIALMVGGKKKDSLTAADRIYYGVPESRGHIDADSNLNLIYNCYYISVLDENLFGEVERASNISIYEKFLLDFFYRRFMGYENHYFRAPKDEEHFNAYNRMAVESGHPEWVMKKEEPKADTSKKADESSDKDKSEKSAETSEENKSEEHAESGNAGKVDVLDADGNVIAENCDTNTAPKKPEKEEEGQTEQEDKKEPNPAKKNDAKDKKESDAEASVIFYEIDPNGRQFNVDKNRHNEFKEVNAPVIKQYPGLEKLVEACKKQNKLVCLRFKDPDTNESYNGLVHATIFDKGVPGSALEVFIDPAKVRDHYSFIHGAPSPNCVYPFENPMVSFDKYLDKYIATNGNLPAEDRAAVDFECMSNYKFLYHIMYSSVPKSDLSDAAKILTPLFQQIDMCNLSLRFKAIDYTSKYSFTLYCGKDVGLGKYAKDNARFHGLRIIVRAASDTDIKYRAVGEHAQEFRDILFNNSLGAFDMKVSNDAKTPEQKDNEKPNPEHGKKQDKKPKQPKQEKKEPEVNPAEVVKEVEQDQKPQEQANEMTPEQRAAWGKKKKELKQQSEIQTTEKSPEEKAAEEERAANFAEAMKNQKQEQIVEASSGIH